MKLILKVVLSLFAFAIAGNALYRMVEPTGQTPPLKNLITEVPWAGYLHIAAGSLALILGALQLSSRIRRKNIQLHKMMGNAYVACVLISTIGAIVSLPHSKSSFAATSAFWLLAFVWPIVTLAGYPWRGRFDVKWHGKLMIYSYALTCAAISLRLILIPLLVSGTPFSQAYPIAAWGGGIVNVIIVFFALRIIETRVASKSTKEQMPTIVD